MASYTKNLELLKKDPVEDGADTFNIETMLNENWDKIDEKVATGKAMNDHVTNQKNPHKVTAEQVGAASSVHSHTIDQVEGLTTALSNKADLADPQWYDLVLENEFKPSGPIAYNRYSRDQFGRITVQFNLVTKTLLNVDNGTKFATIPVGFRPSNRQLEFASYDPQRGKDIVIHLEDGNFTAGSSETSGYTAIVTEITFLSGS